MNRSLLAIRIFATFALMAMLPGCAKKETSVAKPVEKPVEKPVDMSQVNKIQPKLPVPEPLPPATMQDVKAAVQRNLGDNVVISSRFKPVYIIGDFNGDEIEDLAVMVEPVPARLGDINSEFANWIIQDADQYFIAPANARTVKLPELHRPQIEKNETVLVIIHGFGTHAWRDPQARQTYVVKHAAAAFTGISKSFNEKSVRALKLPVRSDVIKAHRDSKRGVLFWTGSNYAWKSNNG